MKRESYSILILFITLISILCTFAFSAWRAPFDISCKAGLGWWTPLDFVCLGKLLFLLHSWRITWLDWIFLADSFLLSIVWICPSTLFWPVEFLGRNLLIAYFFPLTPKSSWSLLKESSSSCNICGQANHPLTTFTLHLCQKSCAHPLLDLLSPFFHHHICHHRLLLPLLCCLLQNPIYPL